MWRLWVFVLVVLASPRIAHAQDNVLVPGESDSVLLFVSSNPKGASVLLNGQYQCVTPCEIRLPRNPNPIEITTQLPGYQEPKERLIPDKNNELFFELLPLPPFIGASGPQPDFAFREIDVHAYPKYPREKNPVATGFAIVGGLTGAAAVGSQFMYCFSREISGEQANEFSMAALPLTAASSLSFSGWSYTKLKQTRDKGRAVLAAHGTFFLSTGLLLQSSLCHEYAGGPRAKIPQVERWQIGISLSGLSALTLVPALLRKKSCAAQKIAGSCLL